MGDSDPDLNVYAAPRAGLSWSVPRRQSLRFRVTSVVSALAFPFAFSYFMRLAPPDWARAIFLAACWIVPVAWILLPDLRKSGSLRELSWGHVVVTSIAFFGALVGIVFAIGVAAIGGLYVYEFFRHSG
jgi:hypothetical protein